ncbi:Fic family protein [Candidatus Odyssella thessalonicensis]|uniref:Fic family protein n=1 Tax=Candidatus Odyssella thessalonicensis TaxID=84647 RepID=UPI000225BAF6|nr:Fic family protein [Candidatus Odyssella thessalonicensis]
MENYSSNHFSYKLSFFQERKLPEAATLAGYSCLIHSLKLQVPLPLKLYAISDRHKVYEKDNWKVLTPRHMPAPTLEDHLIFALKYEGLDLAVLKAVFEAINPEEIKQIVIQKPTSSYSRRLWFLYEWLLETPLSLENVITGNYANVLDTDIQYGSKGTKSPRHRVINNLPGCRDFCPLVFKTEILESYRSKNLDERAKKIIGKTSASILARTASFLLLKDSKSSYAIEGEEKLHTRIQRWGRAIGEAGKQPLNLAELLRLQKIVIGDDRFVRLGLRDEGGFVGEHEQITRLPLPEHISARPEDLPSLMQGLFSFINTSGKEFDPVIAAACVAFGFIYIHPFADGNGRLHRYLIHHILAERQFSPAGLIFPISAAILERIDDYRSILESYSKRLLPLIEWEPTLSMNIEVLNKTDDFYRYFDATPHTEFLYACVEKTVTVDLPQEIEFLQRYDTFKQQINAFLELPSSKVDLLFNFLKQNDGKLSKRALHKEFSALKEAEITHIESIYADVFISDGAS